MKYDVYIVKTPFEWGYNIRAIVTPDGSGEEEAIVEINVPIGEDTDEPKKIVCDMAWQIADLFEKVDSE